MAHDAGQAHGPTIDQRHAPAPAENAEYGVLLDDAQIAPKRKFKSARNRIPRNGGDNRFGKKHPRRSHRRRGAIGANPVAPVTAAGKSLEVRACAKCAVIAEENPNAGAFIRLEGFERGGKLRRRRRIDRILRAARGSGSPS